MKKKQLQELRSKSQEDLEKLVSQKRADLSIAQSNIKVKKEKNLKKIKNLRHEIAQTATVLHEMQIFKENNPEKESE